MFTLVLAFAPCLSIAGEKCTPEQDCWNQAEAKFVHEECAKLVTSYLATTGLTFNVESFESVGFNTRATLSDGRVSYVGNGVHTNNNIEFYDNRKPRGTGKIWVTGGRDYIANNYVMMCSFAGGIPIVPANIDIMVMPAKNK